MSREFGKIMTALWHSRRYRALPADSDRYFYLYCHTNPNGNSIGCYHLRPGYVMEDLHWGPDQVKAALEACQQWPDSPMDSHADRLGEAGDTPLYIDGEGDRLPLLLYDEAEKVVYITDFLKHTPITNEKHAKGAVSAALSLPDCPLKGLVLCDILASGHLKAAAVRQAALEAVVRCRRMTEDRRILRAIDRAIPTQTETKTETQREKKRAEGQGQTGVADSLPPRVKPLPAGRQGPEGGALPPEGEVAFQEFLDAFEPSSGLEKGREIWLADRLWESDELPLIMAAARKERERRPTLSHAPCGAGRWLEEARWRLKVYQGIVVQSKTPEQESRDLWAARFAIFKKTGKWPRPGLDKSTCPPDIMAAAEEIDKEAAHA